MSMRMAASACQVTHVRTLPRGARIERAGISRLEEAEDRAGVFEPTVAVAMILLILRARVPASGRGRVRVEFSAFRWDHPIRAPPKTQEYFLLSGSLPGRRPNLCAMHDS
jgi:hypothetical protein